MPLPYTITLVTDVFVGGHWLIVLSCDRHTYHCNKCLIDQPLVPVVHIVNILWITKPLVLHRKSVAVRHILILRMDVCLCFNSEETCTVGNLACSEAGVLGLFVGFLRHLLIIKE